MPVAADWLLDPLYSPVIPVSKRQWTRPNAGIVGRNRWWNPKELFALAGVDLTSPAPVVKTFGVLAGMLARFQVLAGRNRWRNPKELFALTSPAPVEKTFGVLVGMVARLETSARCDDTEF